jgi:peptide/nickel transport system permease protein
MVAAKQPQINKPSVVGRQDASRIEPGGLGPIRIARTSWVARMMRSRTALPAATFIAFLIVIAVFGNQLAPYDPYQEELTARLQAPSLQHPLGTDSLGRDLLSRLLAGTGIDLTISVEAVAIAVLLGTVVGLIAGYYGGMLDSALVSAIDVMLAFPALLLALIVVSALGPNILNAMIAIGIVYIPVYARLVRSGVLTVKQRDFVLAARAIGASSPRIMVRHVFVNSASPIIVQSSLILGAAIVTAATFSFLGLGAQPPSPEWGRMLSDGRDFMRQAWWIATFPGIAILLTVIAFNLLGDSLRDALDPRVKT